jgi:exonuclease VII small subunit
MRIINGQQNLQLYSIVKNNIGVTRHTRTDIQPVPQIKVIDPATPVLDRYADRVVADKELSAARDDFNHAKKELETALANRDTVQNAFDNANDVMFDAVAVMERCKDTLAKNRIEIDEAQKEYTVAESDYTAKQEAYTQAFTVVSVAEHSASQAISARDIAVNNFRDDSTPENRAVLQMVEQTLSDTYDDLIAARAVADEARVAANNADSVRNAKLGILTDKQSQLPNAQTELTAALQRKIAAQDYLIAVQGRLIVAQDKLENAEKLLDETRVNLDYRIAELEAK